MCRGTTSTCSGPGCRTYRELAEFAAKCVTIKKLMSDVSLSNFHVMHLCTLGSRYRYVPITRCSVIGTKGASLSVCTVRITRYEEINFVRMTNEAEGVSLSVHVLVPYFSLSHLPNLRLNSYQICSIQKS